MTRSQWKFTWLCVNQHSYFGKAGESGPHVPFAPTRHATRHFVSPRTSAAMRALLSSGLGERSVATFLRLTGYGLGH